MKAYSKHPPKYTLWAIVSSILYRRDVLQVVNDLGEMSIQHGDFRWPNIVSAPEAPPGMVGSRCPRHGVRHKWRIVDFELSRKAKVPSRMMKVGYQRMVKDLFQALARGDFL